MNNDQYIKIAESMDSTMKNFEKENKDYFDRVNKFTESQYNSLGIEPELHDYVNKMKSGVYEDIRVKSSEKSPNFLLNNSKFKINLYCNDSLKPSTSDKNTSKFTEWVYDGSGSVSLYVNQRSLDILQDVSDTPKYIWLLESKQIIQGVYDWILANYDFVSSRVDGILSCDRELCEKYPKFQYALTNAAPWIEERKIYEKTKLVSMISSNKAMVPGHRKRLEFVNKFMNSVDLYGRGFRDLPRKEEGLKDYMFSIAVENAVYDTYFTEKLTDCFATGTIPIFYGCRGVTKYFNEDGIIFLDDDFDISTLTEELYYSKMDAIKDNFERANNLPVAEDYLYETYWK